MSPSTRQQRKLAYAAWVAVCLIWGTTYLGIRVSLETMPPALMGGLRWTLAGGLLALWLVLRGETAAAPSRWGPVALLGFLMLVLGNGGVVFAEQWLPSGLTAVLVATSPFWMAGIEAFLPDGEKLRLSVVAGLVARLQRHCPAGLAGADPRVVRPPRFPARHRRRADRRVRLVARLVVLETAHAGRPTSSGTTALQMLAGGLMMMLVPARLAASGARCSSRHGPPPR